MSDLQNLVIDNNFYLWLITAFFSALSSFTSILVFVQIFKVKYKKITIAVSVIIDSVVCIFCMINNSMPIFRGLRIIVLFFVYKFLLEQTTERSLVGILFNIIIAAISKLIFSKIFFNIYPGVSIPIEEHYKYMYIFWITLGICSFRLATYTIIRIKGLSINIGDYIRKPIKYSIIVTTIATIGVYFIIEVAIHFKNFTEPIFFIHILLLIFIAYISVKSIIRLAMMEELAQKIHNLETYNKTLSIMYDSLRGFRHDYANFIQALNGYIQIDDLKGIKELIRSITKDCISVNNMGILDFKTINNPAVYSIINNKYYSAQDKNIQMNVEVMIDINSIKMSIYELCRILGILIDNAIEAAEKCEDKVINIRFVKDVKVDRKLIIIENSYYNKEVDVEKIFEKGVSSKDNVGKEHGLGLWIIRNILRKNENVNLYTTKGELFCQQLEVYES